jgi:hypothetical protein
MIRYQDSNQYAGAGEYSGRRFRAEPAGPVAW